MVNKDIINELQEMYVSGKDFSFLICHLRGKYNLCFSTFCELISSLTSLASDEELEILRKIGRRMYQARYRLGSLLITIVEVDDFELAMKTFFKKGYTTNKVKEWIEQIKRWPLFSEKDIIKLDSFCKQYTTYYCQNSIKITGEKNKDCYNEQIQVSVQMVEQFLKSGQSVVKCFCEENDIKIGKFNSGLALLRKLNHPVIEQYEAKIKEGANMNDVLLIKGMISKIINGIPLDSGKTRDFDLVDYYESTSLNFDELLYIVRGKLTPTESKALMKFILKYRKDIPIGNLEIIYNMKQFVGVKFDEQGRTIPNTGKEITMKEKHYIIEYLNSHNVPITNATYNAAVRRLAFYGLKDNEALENSNTKKVKIKKKTK